MNETTASKPKKQFVLFQQCKRPYTRSVAVYPGSKEGLDQAMEAVQGGCKAWIFITDTIPSTVADILNVFELKAISGEGKVVQS